MIWVPYTTSNGTWIASKILQGFFGAPIESLCEISVGDIYFSHERGTYMAFYAFMLAGSNFLAPILAGFIDDGQGWQWVQVQSDSTSTRFLNTNTETSTGVPSSVP
jgi:MFS family permease